MVVHTDAPDVRADEDAVRVLLVEDSSTCAGLFCAALERADRGRFEVECASALSAAESTLSSLDSLDFDAVHYDAVLVDLAVSEPRAAAIDAVCELAHRVPVIALSGTREGALAELAAEVGDPRPDDLGWDDSLGLIDRADLPATILRAVRRHRRLGVCGAVPTFCRIPAD